MQLSAATTTTFQRPDTTLGTVKLTDADGGSTRDLPIEQPKVSELLHGSFRDAISAARDMARAASDGWLASKFNSQPSIAVVGAGTGAYELFPTRASIHRFNPIDSAKYVQATVTKVPGSPLLAVVSRTDWADLRTSDVADGQALRTLPVYGPIVPN